MVHIKKVDIFGFKSFGFKNTSVNFEQGLVSISGPNGSGKSNILDAIIFATCKQGMPEVSALAQSMLKAYKTRHDLMLAALNKIDGIDCLPSDGTFYLFPNMQPIIERLRLEDDVALAGFFLENAGVAMVPGTAFGAPDHIRISCATSEENLNKAIGQIQEQSNLEQTTLDPTKPYWSRLNRIVTDRTG